MNGVAVKQVSLRDVLNAAGHIRAIKHLFRNTI